MAVTYYNMFYVEVCSHFFEIIVKLTLYNSVYQRLSEGFLKKRYSEKFRKIDLKTSVSESDGLTKTQVFSYKFYEVSKNTFLIETPTACCFLNLTCQLNF